MNEKSWLLALIVSALILGIGSSCYFISRRIAGATLPQSQIISQTEGICIGFYPTTGSGEYVQMFTYQCESPLIDEGIVKKAYKQEKYLDLVVTMECPVIRIQETGQDGDNKIYVKQDWLCKAFTHPGLREPTEIHFSITKTGKFLKAYEKS